MIVPRCSSSIPVMASNFECISKIDALASKTIRSSFGRRVASCFKKADWLSSFFCTQPSANASPTLVSEAISCSQRIVTVLPILDCQSREMEHLIYPRNKYQCYVALQARSHLKSNELSLQQQCSEPYLQRSRLNPLGSEYARQSVLPFALNWIRVY